MTPKNQPEGTRTTRLLLGAFALAFLALLTLVLQTPETPAPSAAAGAGHPAVTPPADTAPASTAQHDPGGDAVLEDVQGEMIERKNALLRDLIAAVAEYGRLRDVIYAAHPDVREIPALLKWLQKMPQEQFPQGAEEWAAAYAHAPLTQARSYMLIALKKADVWLALLDDPKFGPYVDTLFKDAAFSNRVVNDMMVLDTTTGYQADALSAATSPAAFRAAYEARAPVYAAAATARQQQWGLQVTGAMDDYLMAAAQQRVMRDYLRYYHDHFFGAAEAAATARVEELQRQLTAFPASIQADPELLAQYRQLAAAVQVGPLMGK